MKWFPILFLVTFVANAATEDEKGPHNAKKVEEINKMNLPFKARVYKRFEGLDHNQLKSFLGAKDSTKPNKKLIFGAGKSTGRPKQKSKLPKSFEVWSKWPNCKTVFHNIQDKSNCTADWAIAVASMLSDRRCIKYGVRDQLSAWDLVSCCDECKNNKENGCLDGGSAAKALEFYQQEGIVTGDSYDMKKGCKSYPLEPNLPYTPQETVCKKECTSPNMNDYETDKKRGGVSYSIQPGVNDIMNEIMQRGPVIAQFKVYDDFFSYGDGVYRHTTGDYVNEHQVKVVGWGETDEGEKYWLAVNDWGSTWGEGGLFRIERENNGCDFEFDMLGADVGNSSGSVSRPAKQTTTTPEGKI